jgi:RHS repeat-associated protein
VEVYCDSQLTQLVASANNLPGNLLTTTWQLTPALSAGGHYYWWVRASDGQLNSAWSGTQNFKVVKLAGTDRVRFAYSRPVRLNGVQVATIGSLGGLTGGETEAIFFYHTDHLGTPLMLTDQVGQVVWSAEYLPFGEPVSVNEDVDGDGVVVTNNLRFPGQYQDQETGLHYNMARDYKLQLGRYLEVDPIGLDVNRKQVVMLRGINHLYVYVNNNPVRLSDPLGLAPYPACLQKQIAQCINDSVKADRNGSGIDCVANAARSNYGYYFGGTWSNCRDKSGKYTWSWGCLMQDLSNAISQSKEYIAKNCPCCKLPDSCQSGMAQCIGTIQD